MTYAQKIQNEVVSNAGFSANHSGINMAYTIGEIVIETFSGSTKTLTQGFHQTGLTITAVSATDLFSDINIYPNPTMQYLYIDMPPHDSHFDVDITLYDIMGRVAVQQKKGGKSLPLDISHLPDGAYHLHIVDTKNLQYKIFKIIKTH